MFLCISSIFMRFMEPAVLFKPIEINENSIFFRFFTTKTQTDKSFDCVANRANH
jgi:hypothetical protein